jgi:hypothetical protein
MLIDLVEIQRDMGNPEYNLVTTSLWNQSLKYLGFAGKCIFDFRNTRYLIVSILVDSSSGIELYV